MSLMNFPWIFRLLKTYDPNFLSCFWIRKKNPDPQPCFRTMLIVSLKRSKLSKKDFIINPRGSLKRSWRCITAFSERGKETFSWPQKNSFDYFQSSDHTYYTATNTCPEFKKILHINIFCKKVKHIISMQIVIK